MSARTKFPADASALSAADKARTVEGVANSGRSTQETHRAAIHFESGALDKVVGALGEQMKHAESPEERAAISDKVLKVHQESAARVTTYAADSNSVFQYVVVFGAAALGIGAAAFSLLGTSKK